MRVLRRITHVFLIVVTLVIGAAAAAIIVTQTAWFKEWLRGYIVREANLYLNGQLTIQRLGGNLFFGVEMENIGVSMDGSEVVAVKDLGLDYNVFEFITRGLSVSEIRLDKPVLYLRRDGSTWSIARLVKKQQTEANRSGPGRPITINAIGISDGSVVLDKPVATSGVEVPERFDRIDAQFSFKYQPVRYSIEINHVSFQGSDPAIALRALSGGIAVHDDAVHVDKLSLRTAESSVSIDGAVQQYLTKPTFNMHVSSDKLSIPEIGRVVRSLAGVRLQPAFDLRLSGPLDRLGVDMNVRSSAGLVSTRLVADVVTPGQSVNGTLSIRHLDLSPILKNPKEKSDITADTQVDVRSTSFSDLDSLRGGIKLDAPRVAMDGYAAERIKADAKFTGRRVALNAQAGAYGASATATGHATIPEGKSPLEYDVHGAIHHVDLRRLPRDLKVPPAATDVNAEYHVAGRAQAVHGDARFAASSLAGAKIAPGSTVGFSMDGKQVGYRADATVSNLDLERVGQAFGVKALATDRYKSDLNAHVTADGSGTAPKAMTVTANATVTDSTLLGGRIPTLDVAANVANDTAHVKATGAFAGFDPAVASGKPAMKGTVGGDLDVDATVDGFSKGVTTDNVQADAKLNLQPSTVAGLKIDHAKLDATYHAMTGDVRTLDVAGPDLNVQATGTVALNDTGSSNLKLHADSPNLQQIGTLVDQPITGIGKVDATITGNRSNLQAAGNVTADGASYGGNGALTLSTNYTVKIPELKAADASVSADTHATFVKLGGLNINELQAKTDYAGKDVTFNVNARQPQRTLAAGGSLLLHPDHQEVHLQQLAVESSGMRWQIAPGDQPAIDYGNNAIAVKDLRLVSGNQQITANGTFGQNGNALKVSLNAVQLSDVDALLLRPPQLSGTVNATSTISGTKAAPQVKADFKVDRGGFRQFHYDSFAGTADYRSAGVTLDARLQQNPTTWITAKGYLPTALFSTPAPGARAGAADRVDFHVDSSPIDLGLVQGFTTALTNVKGTLHAKIDLTGTAEDPDASGDITVQNASFTAVPTGVVYTDLDGRIDLQPDRVHIDQIRVLDNQKKPLTISGDLALRERKLAGVSLALKADDFKVIDNKMGNVRVKSDLRLAGDLRQPRLEGDLGITTGSIDLDPILAQVGTSAYATKPTEYATGETPQQNNGQTPAPTGFDALRMNIHLTVPNDLVIKASDLRAPGASIGLGSMNITLGGDLTAQKNPGDTIRLVGTVNTVRGYYDFQGRRFTLQRDGRIQFVGLPEINPNLDIRAQRVIQSVQANVNVRGTLREPQLILTSTPPLEQGDILALIIFNQPLNQLGEGQQISLTQRAEQMASGAIANSLARSIGSALNLDQFEVQMAPTPGETAQITVGQQVSQNLYVKVQQGVGDVSTTNFILEYELTNWLRLQTNLLEGSSGQQMLFQRQEDSGADLIFFFRY